MSPGVSEPTQSATERDGCYTRQNTTCQSIFLPIDWNLEMTTEHTPVSLQLRDALQAALLIDRLQWNLALTLGHKTCSFLLYYACFNPIRYCFNPDCMVCFNLTCTHDHRAGLLLRYHSSNRWCLGKGGIYS